MMKFFVLFSMTCSSVFALAQTSPEQSGNGKTVPQEKNRGINQKAMLGKNGAGTYHPETAEK